MKTLLVDAVRTIITSDIEYNYDTWWLNKDLADFLKNLNNIRIVVVTNAPWIKFDKIIRYLSDYSFEIYSLQNNPWKTEVTYRNTLLLEKNLNPSDCFYFDHKQENLDAAKQAGIQWVLYLNNDQIIWFLNSK